LLFLFGTIEDRCKHLPHARRQCSGQALHCREPSLVRACVRVHHGLFALLALGRRSHGGPLLPIAFWVEPRSARDALFRLPAPHIAQRAWSARHCRQST
jgi:hypothetical protein